LPRSIPYYLTFDVDVLDPQSAPATGTPVPGGLSYYQALELLDFAYQNFDIVGVDFVEVARSGLRANATAGIVAQFLLRFLLAQGKFKALSGVLREPLADPAPR
jgi:arginase family enzyme